jgi:hypothetical protein
METAESTVGSRYFEVYLSFGCGGRPVFRWVVVDGNLPTVRGNGHWKFAAWIHVTEENITIAVSTFGPRHPCFEYGRDVFENPANGWRLYH